MNDQFMKPCEVAEFYNVHPKTVTRWVKKGLLRAIKTPGGHNRILRTDVIESSADYLPFIALPDGL